MNRADTDSHRLRTACTIRASRTTKIDQADQPDDQVHRDVLDGGPESVVVEDPGEIVEADEGAFVGEGKEDGVEGREQAEQDQQDARIRLLNAYAHAACARSGLLAAGARLPPPASQLADGGRRLSEIAMTASFQTSDRHSSTV